MRSIWSEPFLWIHFAGLATVPLWLAVLLLMLAVGNPILPVWQEISAIALIALTPILGMQLLRPFNIFSILFIALKPEKLSDEQRKILSLFKRPIHKLLALLAAIFLVWVLWEMYSLAPIASNFAPFPSEWRLLSLSVATVVFFLCNLFFQVPVSVLAVLLTGESQLTNTEPYPTEKISQDFTAPGFQVNQIWPIESSSTTPIN